MDELEVYLEQPYKTRVQLDAFVMRCDVIAMIADEMRIATAAMVTESIASTVCDTVANVIEVGYTFMK